MIAQLERSLGAPVRLELLKQTTGVSTTYRARGSRRTAIVKRYELTRSRAAARRFRALCDGPLEPGVPRVLVETDDMVVLSELHGRPLRAAVLAGDEAACERAGTVLGLWHWFWRDHAPDALPRHTLEQELQTLRRLAERAPATVVEAVAFALKALEDDEEWPPASVIHRDLSEEQVLIGDEVGLIGLDDAAIGPPELDVGNLCASLEFLARRYGRSLDAMQHAFLNGYLSTGAPLGLQLLLTCRSLNLLRLACIHKDEHLATAHAGAAWPPPPDIASAG